MIKRETYFYLQSTFINKPFIKVVRIYHFSFHHFSYLILFPVVNCQSWNSCKVVNFICHKIHFKANMSHYLVANAIGAEHFQYL